MEQLAKNGVLNLRALNGAFVTNIQGKTEKKRCICIPIDDNFIVEKGYTTNNGKEIRTAELSFKQWPVSDESRERAGYNIVDVRSIRKEHQQRTEPYTIEGIEAAQHQCIKGKDKVMVYPMLQGDKQSCFKKIGSLDNK